MIIFSFLLYNIKSMVSKKKRFQKTHRILRNCKNRRYGWNRIQYAPYVCSIFHLSSAISRTRAVVYVYRRFDDKIYLTLANTDAVAYIGLCEISKNLKLISDTLWLYKTEPGSQSVHSARLCSSCTHTYYTKYFQFLVLFLTVARLAIYIVQNNQKYFTVTEF